MTRCYSITNQLLTTFNNYFNLILRQDFTHIKYWLHYFKDCSTNSKIVEKKPKPQFCFRAPQKFHPSSQQKKPLRMDHCQKHTSQGTQRCQNSLHSYQFFRFFSHLQLFRLVQVQKFEDTSKQRRCLENLQMDELNFLC